MERVDLITRMYEGIKEGTVSLEQLVHFLGIDPEYWQMRLFHEQPNAFIHGKVHRLRVRVPGGMSLKERILAGCYDTDNSEVERVIKSSRCLVQLPEEDYEVAIRIERAGSFSESASQRSIRPERILLDELEDQKLRPASIPEMLALVQQFPWLQEGLRSISTLAPYYEGARLALRADSLYGRSIYISLGPTLPLNLPLLFVSTAAQG